MPSLNANPQSPERIDLHAAADELALRLEELRRRVSIVRNSFIGESEEKEPSLVDNNNDLESKIFAFNQTLDRVDFIVGRIGSRLGVSFTQAACAPKPRA